MIRTLYTVDDQVVFTSDNGFLLGEHRATGRFLPYRKAVEVPFLLRWPGRVAAGAVDDRLVTHVDVLPTILAATGVTQSRVTLDGRDTAPLSQTLRAARQCAGSSCP